jgi:hypothetical protein
VKKNNAINEKSELENPQNATFATLKSKYEGDSCEFSH